MSTRGPRGTRFDRRRLLQAMGLTTGGLFLPSLMSDRKAYAAPLAKRLVVFLTDHGPVTEKWQMRRPGLPETSADWDFPLDDADPMSFSETLRPLHPFRKDLLILDGLAYISAYHDPFVGNAHAGAVPNRLAARGNTQGPSVDQVIAESIGADSAFKYLFYTNRSCDCWSGSPVYDLEGNQVPPGRLGGASYLGYAFDRVFGGLPDTDSTPPPSAATPLELSQERRLATLELVRGEYDKLLGKLGAEDREKLTRHRDMVADLEAQVATLEGTICEKPDWPVDGLPSTEVTSVALSSLYTVAMACDLTRVAVLGAKQLDTSDIGAPADLDVHQAIAHPSKYDPASTWMTNYYKLHAEQFAKLIAAFEAVDEGSGTMLDNSLLIWVPELANGWHDRNKLMIVMAGGAGGAFKTGRYVKYKETSPVPKNGYDVEFGPPHSKLLVSILQAFGVDQNSIGVPSVLAKDGSSIDLTGPLPNLS